MDLSDMRNMRLVDVKLSTETSEYPLFLPDEAKEVHYCLNLTYRAENVAGEWEINFPKVMLPFSARHLPGTITDYMGGSKIDLGFATLPLEANEKGQYAFAELIKEKVHDMTVDEIERRLGYRIRIVGEDSK